ncbi:hypothetical protein P7K49_021909 [Saguinus oedipus]|uniref:Uncharacterized protein n=1 Tax=Saguinus oedipus TaxID=9490 RepID=A0ABQ9UU32_SAGOE|nr:hypothetical protein P7K49_021909 [Saguinus oedipus]
MEIPILKDLATVAFCNKQSLQDNHEKADNLLAYSSQITLALQPARVECHLMPVGCPAPLSPICRAPAGEQPQDHADTRVGPQLAPEAQSRARDLAATGQRSLYPSGITDYGHSRPGVVERFID